MDRQEFVIILAPHFVAGYDISSGNIAPIIKYMKGWTLKHIKDYCSKRGWGTIVSSTIEPANVRSEENLL